MTMKKTTKILLLVCLCLLLVGCRNHSGITVFGSYNYSDAGRYRSGGASVQEASELNINWVDGSVTVGFHKGQEIVFSEQASGRLTEESSLHWRLNNGVLYVKYAASGFRTGEGLNKQLTVLLPEGMRLDAVRIDAVSADVGLEAGMVDDLVVNAVSGNVHAVCDEVRTAAVDSVSGDVQMKFAHAPASIRINTVSGDAVAEMPRTAGFTARVDTVSGAVGGSMPMTESSRGRYVSGDGSCDIRIDTVSGDVRLNAAQD